ncbi:MAG: hypothetical protein ACQESB_02105 [Elusimicrobiota bacterium]
MKQWKIKQTKKYTKQYRKYEEKHPDELTAVLENFETYKMVVDMIGNPFHPKIQNRGFFHPEPKGIAAIDQAGVITDKTLQETRFYLYPDKKNEVLYLLTIGSKKTQEKDIKWCKDMLKKIK